MAFTTLQDVVNYGKSLAGIDAVQGIDNFCLELLNDAHQIQMEKTKLLEENYIETQQLIDLKPYTNEYTLATDVDKMLSVNLAYAVPTASARVTATAYTAGQKVSSSGKTYIAMSAFTSKTTFLKDLCGQEGATAWLPTTSYTVTTSYVYYNGKGYQCASSHTSTSTFDETKWTELFVGRRQVYENYVPARKVNRENKAISAYNQYPPESPVLMFQNNKIKIFPYPTVAVTEGLVLVYAQKVSELTLASATSLLGFDQRYRRLLANAIVPGIFQSLQQDQRMQNAIVTYNNKLLEYLKYINNRYETAETQILPDLSHYAK